MTAESFVSAVMLMQACRVRMLFQPAMSEDTAGFFWCARQRTCVYVVKVH